ncbi:MAG: hypothetical protein JOZ65_14180 [Chloroflexi bacterium]|nr:hypothetical protein [Chloroflexota bacterium]
MPRDRVCKKTSCVRSAAHQCQLGVGHGVPREQRHGFLDLAQDGQHDVHCDVLEDRHGIQDALDIVGGKAPGGERELLGAVEPLAWLMDGVLLLVGHAGWLQMETRKGLPKTGGSIDQSINQSSSCAG